MLFLSGVCASSLTGCAFLQKKERTVIGAPGQAEGQWRAKALVKNLRTNQSGSLSLEIIAREPSSLRMEVYGSFGVHLASIALQDEEIRYLLSQEKRFIVASADARSLSHVIPIRISPRDLIRVLFDRVLPEEEWNCEKSSSGEPQSCQQRDGQLSIRWEERHEGKRRLKIGSAEANVEMVIEEAKSKVEVQPEIFHLESPADYHRENFL